MFFSIFNFGNSGVPGKPDFGLQGWSSGDFGNPYSPDPLHQQDHRIRSCLPVLRNLQILW